MTTLGIVEAAVARLLDKHGAPIWQECADGGKDCFAGFANEERHRTCGGRAWCDCGEWCYPTPEMACLCCSEHVVDERSRRMADLLASVLDAHPDRCACIDSLHAMDNRCHAAVRLAREIMGVEE